MSSSRAIVAMLVTAAVSVAATITFVGGSAPWRPDAPSPRSVPEPSPRSAQAPPVVDAQALAASGEQAQAAPDLATRPESPDRARSQDPQASDPPGVELAGPGPMDVVEDTRTTPGRPTPGPLPPVSAGQSAADATPGEEGAHVAPPPTAEPATAEAQTVRKTQEVADDPKLPTETETNQPLSPSVDYTHLSHQLNAIADMLERFNGKLVEAAGKSDPVPEQEDTAPGEDAR